MNVANFASEFSQLVLRWTSPPSPRNEETLDSIKAPLTTQEVVNTVQEVLSTILHVELQNPNNSTPVNVISLHTPNAPSGPKINFNKKIEVPNLGLSLMSNGFSIADDASRHCEDMEIASEENMLVDEKKDNETTEKKLERSDTFTREEAKNKSPSVDSVFESKETNSTITSKAFYDKLEMLRKSAADIISCIDTIRRPLLSQSTRAIRRLSSIGSSGLSQSSAVMRSIPPPKIRRSVTTTTFPGTPTSSRLTPKEKDSLSRKKSTSSTSLNILSTPKLSTSSTNNTGRLSVPSSIKKTPSPSARNPKYAHIQSTIPKARNVAKRKNP